MLGRSFPVGADSRMTSQQSARKFLMFDAFASPECFASYSYSRPKCYVCENDTWIFILFFSVFMLCYVVGYRHPALASLIKIMLCYVIWLKLCYNGYFFISQWSYLLHTFQCFYSLISLAQLVQSTISLVNLRTLYLLLRCSSTYLIVEAKINTYFF